MFRSLLQRLSQPGSARLWTTFVGLAFAALFIGLDNTILELALPLPDQSGAESSALRWVDRAKAITDWSGTAATAIGFGPFAGLLVVVGTGRTFARRSSKSA
jgi:hypothetical protein